MVGWEWEGEWRSEMNGKEGLESVAFKGRGLREVGIFAELERERDERQTRFLYFPRSRQKGTLATTRFYAHV